MDTLQQLKKVEEIAVKQGKEEETQSTKHERSTSTAAASAGSLPPSSSSSPSHEFSFTISLHPSNKCKPTPSFDFDLSPADEIFFHGHLLPLHLLSHTSISPRSSTSDALNLPTHQPFDVQNLESSSNNNNDDDKNTTTTTSEIKRKIKSKSFSLSKLTKWRKSFETGERWEDKKKLKFEVSRVLKRYAKAVRPFLFFHGGDKEKRETRRQPHSFSGNLNSKWKEWGGKRAGEFSAPASMWTSPTNSGLLVPTAAVSKSNDSTMEELQSAIQAAITHCKNSIAVKEEKCKC